MSAEQFLDAVWQLTGAAPDDGPASGEAAAILAEHLDNLAGELRTAIGYSEHRFDSEIRRLHIQGAGAAIPGIEARGDISDTAKQKILADNAVAIK